MKTNPEPEELKPCPFCGKLPIDDLNYDAMTCHGCLGKWMCRWPTKIGWNNAWCWKEIEKLNAALAAEKERVGKLRNLLIPGVERTRLINRGDQNCSFSDIEKCPHHRWLRDAEAVLKETEEK